MNAGVSARRSPLVRASQSFAVTRPVAHPREQRAARARHVREVEIGVQVNGKLRTTITLPRDCPKDEAEAKALASEAVSRYLDGKAPKRVIVVPNRIINVVA